MNYLTYAAEITIRFQCIFFLILLSKSDETQTISGSPAHGKGRSTIDEELLIKAKDLATKVCSSMSFMRKDDIQSAETHCKKHENHYNVLLITLQL